jgi:uncharacterized LabA/DUF88 family protein
MLGIMIGRFTKGIVHVFIDAENVFYSQRTLGWRISYEKLMRYLERECGIETRCFLYKGVDESNAGQKKFLDMLEINGYVVRTKTVKKIRDRESGREEWKGNLDIELAFEMDDLKNSYDTAILFSGDSDFALPIDRIKKIGKRIIVVSTRGHISKELLERAKFIDLRKLKAEISQDNQAPPQEETRQAL